jgi:hypothetical protein
MGKRFREVGFWFALVSAAAAILVSVSLVYQRSRMEVDARFMPMPGLIPAPTREGIDLLEKAASRDTVAVRLIKKVSRVVATAAEPSTSLATYGALLVSSICTFTSVLFGWRQDRRDRHHLELQVKELELKLQEANRKVNAHAPVGL